MIIVAYHTDDPLYSWHAQRFKESVERFDLQSYIITLPAMNDWYKATCHKPTFIKAALEKCAPQNILYVDIDAVFQRPPELIYEIEKQPEVVVGVHCFDRAKNWGKHTSGMEILSGCIYFRNCPEAHSVVDRWIVECKNNPKVWDQKSLEKVLAGKFYNLPESYVKIFNIMQHVQNPVLIHYQASRIAKQGSFKERRHDVITSRSI